MGSSSRRCGSKLFVEVGAATSTQAPEPDELEALLGPPRVRRRLAELPTRPLNYDRALVNSTPVPPGWKVDDLRHPLHAERPGPPEERGSFELAKRLIRSYEFADPSIVRAYYDPTQPLLGRNMVLRLRALGIVQVLVGVRVLEVIDERRTVDERQACVWGWRYGTLQGHLEMGEMSWEVWKWTDSGEIDFRVHAVSQEAQIANPVIRLGFRLVGPHEREVFLHSTGRRMQRFTEIAASSGEKESLRQAAAELTARPIREEAPHAQITRNLERSK